MDDMSVKSPRHDLQQQIRTELICLGRALMPDEDSFVRTTATLALIIVWGVAIVAPMFVPPAEPTPEYITVGLTAIVFAILGRMWGIEVDTGDLAGISIGTKSEDGEDNDGDEG